MKKELIKDINLILDCDLLAKKKTMTNVRGRVIFMKVCRGLGYSFNEIGEAIKIHRTTLCYYDSRKYTSPAPVIDSSIILNLTSKYTFGL